MGEVLRRVASCLTVLIVLSSGMVALSTARASADSTIQVPDGWGLTVDEAHQHLFSTDGTDNEVLVLGFDGSLVSTVSPVSGAGSMILHDGILFVGSSTQNEITEIDTTSLDVVGTIDTGSMMSPGDFAIAGGRLWFADVAACDGFGSVAFDGTGLAVYSKKDGYPCPSLVADPTGATLVAADNRPHDKAFLVYDVSGGTPVLLRKVRNTLAHGDPDMLFASDGQTLLVANIFASAVTALSMSDLTTPTATYSCSPTVYGCTGVAISADGSHVAVESYQQDVIDVYPWDGTSPNLSIVPSGADGPQGQSIAFSADGSKLFALSLASTGTQWVDSYQVFDDPMKWASGLTAAVSPNPQLSGIGVSVQGTLTLSDGAPPAGAAISIVRHNPDGSVTDLGSVQTDTSGDFALDDVPTKVGSYSYEATFAGDTTHRAAVAAAPLTVDANTGQVLFDSNRYGSYYQVFEVSGDGTSPVAELTTSAADSVVPVWSPDGSKIAFMSDRSGNFDLWVMNADGSDQTQLTTNPAFDGYPSWSPNGTRIAFESNRSGNLNIYTVSATGGDLEEVTTNTHVDELPSWSPSGARIAFDSNRSGNYNIYTIRPDGAGLIEKTTNPSADFEARYSPDGTRLAFVSARTGNADLFDMTLSTGRVVDVTNNSHADLDPAWSNDSTKLVFDSNRTGAWQLFEIPIPGGSAAQITSTGSGVVNEFPSWFTFGTPSAFRGGSPAVTSSHRLPGSRRKPAAGSDAVGRGWWGAPSCAVPSIGRPQMC